MNTQHPGDEFTREEMEAIDAVLDQHRGRAEALITVLEKVQDIAGYLPESLQRRVAKALKTPLGRVYGVVTFYSFFTMRPRGKHQIRLCLGTACHVRGAARNFERLTEVLNIEPGGVTEDRLFGLEVVRCLGACGLAPVMTIGDETLKQVQERQLDTLLANAAGEADGAR
jgi:NADH:ubiquinone oxidoreductase subunit E